MVRERLIDIDQAKGLAILLVVIGHITLSSQPQNAVWYELIRIMIYKFHMPFFMYLSGYTMYYVYHKLETIAEYFDYIKKKVTRLLLPLVIFGLIIGLGKYSLQHFIKVDGVPEFAYFEFLKIIIEPTRSFASSVWYIYVLFLFYLIVPLFFYIFHSRIVYILIISVIIHFWRPTDYFAFNSFNEYLLYFAIGMFSVGYRERINQFYDKFCYPILFLWILSFYLIFIDMTGYNSKTIISLISIPALHSLIRKRIFFNNNYLQEYAKFSFSIYLLNTILIGFTKGIILKFISWDGINFYFVAPILIVAGLYGSIYIKRYLFSKVRFIDQMTN